MNRVGKDTNANDRRIFERDGHNIQIAYGRDCGDPIDYFDYAVWDIFERYLNKIRTTAGRHPDPIRTTVELESKILRRECRRPSNERDSHNTRENQ